MGEEIEGRERGGSSATAYLKAALDEYLTARSLRQQEHLKHGSALLAAIQMRVEVELRKDAVADLEATAVILPGLHDGRELPDDPEKVADIEEETCLADPEFAARSAAREDVISKFIDFRLSSIRRCFEGHVRPDGTKPSFGNDRQPSRTYQSSQRRAVATLISALAYQSYGSDKTKMTELLHEVVNLVRFSGEPMPGDFVSFEDTFDREVLAALGTERTAWLRVQWFEVTKLARQLFAEARDLRTLEVQMRTEVAAMLFDEAGRSDVITAMKPRVALATASRIGHDIEIAVAEASLYPDLPAFTWTSAVDTARNLLDLQQLTDSEAW